MGGHPRYRTRRWRRCTARARRPRSIRSKFLPNRSQRLLPQSDDTRGESVLYAIGSALAARWVLAAMARAFVAGGPNTTGAILCRGQGRRTNSDAVGYGIRPLDPTEWPWGPANVIAWPPDTGRCPATAQRTRSRRVAEPPIGLSFARGDFAETQQNPRSAGPARRAAALLPPLVGDPRQDAGDRAGAEGRRQTAGPGRGCYAPRLPLSRSPF